MSLESAARALLEAVEDSGHKADVTAACEALRAALAEPEAQEKADHMGAVMRRLADSLKKVILAARTSGGWQPDAELIAACEQGEEALSLSGMSKAIDEAQADAEPQSEEVEAIIACLEDDAAQLREENSESEVAADMDKAAKMLRTMQPRRESVELSEAQINRHSLKASECPPDSVVILVSSLRRLADSEKLSDKEFFTVAAGFGLKKGSLE